MSIYRSPHDRSPYGLLAQERVPQKGPAARAARQSAKDWEPMRKAVPLNGLLPASRNWLGTLPPPLRPTALATKYPRIVNLVAQQWNDATACRAYLDGLLGGGRPHRRGFPADVRRDILGLREYYVRCRRSAGNG